MFGILRTLLAINVILLHIFGVPSLGNYSVSFFFILSGFLMTHIMQNTYGYNLSGIKQFWVNRFLRLYPTYWIILIITAVVIVLFKDVLRNDSIFMPSTLGNWLQNISIIYPNLVPHRINPRLSPASWALTNELVFYLLISLGVSKTLNRTLFWLLFGIMYFVFTYLYKTDTWRYSAIPAASLPFSIGSLLYYINLKLPKVKFQFYLIITLFFLFCLNALYLRFNIYSNVEISIYVNYFIASFLILSLFNLNVNKNIKNLDNYLGHFSYPFYLSHDLIFIFCMLLGFNNIEGQARLPISDLIPYFLILGIFSFILIYFVDNKIENFKRRNNKITPINK